MIVMPFLRTHVLSSSVCIYQFIEDSMSGTYFLECHTTYVVHHEDEEPQCIDVVKNGDMSTLFEVKR